MARDNKEYQITLQSPISNLCNFTMFHFSVSSLFTIDVTLLSLSFPRQTTVARQRSARGSNKQSHTLDTLERDTVLVLVETIPWQVPPPLLSLPRILQCSAGLGPGSTWPLAPEAAAAWTSTDEQNTIQMIFIIIL